MATNSAFVPFHPVAAAIHWWSDTTAAIANRIHIATKVRQPETFRHRVFEQSATEREMWRL
ncbi:hypothetical protein FZI85_08180 [Mycobacterium sp. CBMA293]|uniref:hypothetical protein n=1 Tax=unclassified Mycolicibacterium TaxID=2636767 RepID=UPI0012DCBAF6|nr:MULTISPECIES: hypothetical protein [unclassified Mycolicibacterium]MUL46426.1 hypothetical protein [Mycolicibacterium sp. CBMA 360]MUL57062.1 hypothetical protein [Mycolicibacterium sp. CBMA 335]MUL70102.1 hypothetical protein [Mycolicibacterium sp. CBMA 311]MUL92150.1 hypothetical protein [Mycolicibacterium sp. CBMA 230]MUM05889.1 hypothetical protein [Mycolicibacterium sp. CBMA 213]